MNWKYQFQFAGFIAAKEKGFYKSVGLDVKIIEYQNNINLIEWTIEFENFKKDFQTEFSMLKHLVIRFEVKALDGKDVFELEKNNGDIYSYYKEYPKTCINYYYYYISFTKEGNNEELTFYNEALFLEFLEKAGLKETD